MSERFVMGDVDHPFIAKLHDLQDGVLVIYGIGAVSRRAVLVHAGLDVLPEREARFYVASVASALGTCARNVIYRDLKPENVMISSSGYVKVIDFGFARRVHLRTFTLCGTPEYLAPEMVMVRGHGKGVDWWALGVLLYEMVMGGAPHIFDRQTNKPHYDLPPNVLYKKILDRNFEFYFPEYASF